MSPTLTVGIIGDHDPNLRYHIATEESLKHAAAALGVATTSAWVPTSSLETGDAQRLLGSYDLLWCSPGSPYRSMEGALRGIRYARENGRPFVGT